MPREHLPTAKGYSSLTQHIPDTPEETGSSMVALCCPEDLRRFANMSSGANEADLVQVRGCDVSLNGSVPVDFVPNSGPFDDFLFGRAEKGDEAVPLLPVDPSAGTGIDDTGRNHNQTMDVIDAGMVYGSDTATVAALRGAAGYLRVSNGASAGSDGAIPAKNVCPADSAALTFMHITFVQEHNRLVAELSTQNPEWTSDDLYYAARMRVEAQLQTIALKDKRQRHAGNGANLCCGGAVENRIPAGSRERSIEVAENGEWLFLFSIGCNEEAESDVSTRAPAPRDAGSDPSGVAKIGGIELIRQWSAHGMATV